MDTRELMESRSATEEKQKEFEALFSKKVKEICEEIGQMRQTFDAFKKTPYKFPIVGDKTGMVGIGNRRFLERDVPNFFYVPVHENIVMGVDMVTPVTEAGYDTKLIFSQKVIAKWSEQREELAKFFQKKMDEEIKTNRDMEDAFSKGISILNGEFLEEEETEEVER